MLQFQIKTDGKIALNEKSCGPPPPKKAGPEDLQDIFWTAAITL